MEVKPSKILITKQNQGKKVTVLSCGKIIVFDGVRLYYVDIDLFCGVRITSDNLLNVKLKSDGCKFFFHVEGKNVEVEIFFGDELKIYTRILSAVAGIFEIKLTLTTVFGAIPRISTDLDGNFDNISERVTLNKVFLRGETKSVIRII